MPSGRPPAAFGVEPLESLERNPHLFGVLSGFAQIYARLGAYDRALDPLLRYPATGGYDGKPCICTRECPAICDGRCGWEACACSFIDNGLDEKLGKAYDRGRPQ